jgi:hypothetical protein
MSDESERMGPVARALVESGRTLDAPNDNDRARVRGRLTAALGVSALSAVAGTQAAAASFAAQGAVGAANSVGAGSAAAGHVAAGGAVAASAGSIATHVGAGSAVTGAVAGAATTGASAGVAAGGGGLFAALGSKVVAASVMAAVAVAGAVGTGAMLRDAPQSTGARTSSEAEPSARPRSATARDSAAMPAIRDSAGVAPAALNGAGEASSAAKVAPNDANSAAPAEPAKLVPPQLQRGSTDRLAASSVPPAAPAQAKFGASSTPRGNLSAQQLAGAARAKPPGATSSATSGATAARGAGTTGVASGANAAARDAVGSANAGTRTAAGRANAVVHSAIGSATTGSSIDRVASAGGGSQVAPATGVGEPTNAVAARTAAVPSNESGSTPAPDAPRTAAPGATTATSASDSRIGAGAALAQTASTDAKAAALPQVAGASRSVGAVPKPAGASKPPALSGELKLLASAQHALRDNELPRALELLNEHATRYSAGALRPERLAARAVVFCRMGERNLGRAEVQKLEAEAPTSPLVRWAREVCGL